MTVHCYLGSCQPSQASSDMTPATSRPPQQPIGSGVYPEFAFTHAPPPPPTPPQPSRSFSAQTRSQQILCITQVRGGAAGCSRQNQEVTCYLCCGGHVIMFTAPDPVISSYHHKLSWCLCQCLLCWDIAFSLGDIYIYGYLFLVLDHTWTSPGFPRTSYWEVRQIQSGGNHGASHSDICVHTLHLLRGKHGGAAESTACLKECWANIMMPPRPVQHWQRGTAIHSQTRISVSTIM